MAPGKAGQFDAFCQIMRLPGFKLLKLSIDWASLTSRCECRVTKVLVLAQPKQVSEHESSPPNTPTINPEKHIIEAVADQRLQVYHIAFSL